MKHKLLIVFLLVISIVGFVGAVPPVQTIVVADSGLKIEATNSLYLKQNTTHTFHFRVYNASTGVYIHPDNVTCDFGLINDTGDIIFNVIDAGAVDYRFDVEIIGGNFTILETYHKGINCLLDDGTAGGVLTQSFQITESGMATPDNMPTFLGILLLIIFGTACFMMFLSGSMNEVAFKIFFLVVALIFLMATLITGYMILTDSNVTSTISDTTLGLVVVMGMILLIIFVWILIRQTINALDLYNIKHGKSWNVGNGSSVGGYNTKRAY